MRNLVEGEERLKEEKEDKESMRNLVEGKDRLKGEQEDMGERRESSRGEGENERGTRGHERA
jgi:hypothetical protein